MKKRASPPAPAVLQRKAQKKLKEQPQRLSALSTRDMKHLITDLGTHQIELEMQNEDLRSAQMELDASSRKYAELFDFAPVGYFTLDTRGMIRDVNRTGAELLGLDKSKLRGKSFSGFLSDPEDQRVFREHCKEVFLKQKPQKCEVRLRREKAGPLYVQLQSMAAENVDRKAGLVRTAVMDITDRRLAEESLIESEHRFRSLFNGMTEGFVLFETLSDQKGKPVDFRCLEVNPAFELLTGLKRSDVIGKTHRQVVPEDTSFARTYGEVARTGLPVHFDRWSPALKRHYDVYVYSPAPGQIALLFLDITERKKAERALKESELRLQLAVSAMNMGIWEWDPANDKAVMSDIYTAQYGRPPETVSPLAWWTDRVHPDERARVIVSLNAALSGKKDTWAEEYRFRRIDGSWAYVYDHSCISRDGTGKPVRMVGGVLDLTARKKLEEALKQTNAELEAVNKELESFSYAIANDLRKPLRSIEGFSRAILEDYANLLDDTGKDYCSRIQAATLRMTQLIEALWTMSRLTSGELAEHIIDLSAAARIIAHELKKREPERQVDFIIATGVKVKGDMDMMRVALENLLENAWKFTGRHATARIEFGVMSQEFGEQSRQSSNSKLPTPNSQLVYYVRDDGAGFDMAFADKLFQPFQRLHTEAEFPGIGIGLAITHNIIKRHGGRMWAEAGVEKGATFFFTL